MRPRHCQTAVCYWAEPSRPATSTTGARLKSRRLVATYAFQIQGRSALVHFVDLPVEGPQVVEVAQAENSGSDQVQQARKPLAQVETVDAEHAQKRQQDPGQRIIDRARTKTEVGLAIHQRNQKQVDDPADAEQTEREEPDRPRDGLAIVKAMSAQEAEDPQGVTDSLEMCVVGHLHHGWLSTSQSGPCQRTNILHVRHSTWPGSLVIRIGAVILGPAPRHSDFCPGSSPDGRKPYCSRRRASWSAVTCCFISLT